MDFYLFLCYIFSETYLSVFVGIGGCEMKLISKLSKPTKVSHVISAVLIALFIFFSMDLYQKNIERDLQSSIDTTLNEISKQQKFGLDNFIEYNIVQLENISTYVATNFEGNDFVSNQSEISNYINSLKDKLPYEHVFLWLGDKQYIDSVGLHTLESDLALPDEKNYVSNALFSPFTDDNCTLFTTPIYDEKNNITAHVIIEISSESISALLLSSFVDTGITAIFDDTGGVVATTDNDDGILPGTNIYNLFPQITFEDGINESNILYILKSGEDESIMSYSMDNIERYFKYLPLNFTDWALIVSVPESAISANANSILFNTTLFTVEILIILLITWFRILTLNSKYNKKLSKAAYYDELTGLMNEKKFKMEMEKALKRNRNTNYSILKLDIINFKVANKILGYIIGDQIIKTVASTKITANENVFLTRVSADEFLLFGPQKELIDLQKIKSIYETDVNNKIYDLCGRKFKFRYSRYQIPYGDINIDEIVDTITITHSFCKAKNYDGIFDYNEDIRNKLLRTAYICEIMEEALNNNEYKVFLQPKNDLKDNSVCGAEALVRWQRPSGEFIYPNEFIPVFEQEGFIIELDKYMLRGVCNILKRFKENGRKLVPISVNFSRLHMLDERFISDLTEIVDEYDLPHNLIEIEMTETSMIDNAENFKKLFQELHNIGFSLSMDDFGAGYSSLALLSELSFDTLKIDKSLLDEVATSSKRAVVIETMLSMAKSLSLKTVCEGVETKEQVEFLKNADCDVAQGYYFAKPMPNEEFEKLL